MSLEPTEASSTGSKRILWLDGWRTIAVGIVILAHWQGLGADNVASAPGKFGVFIFFGISGYIVTKLLLRERAKNGRVNIPAFYLRRSLRILPPLVIYLAACIAVFWGNQTILGGAARSVLFTCNMNIGVGTCGWMFGHTWSLAFEEQFYLLLPFAFLSAWAFRSYLLLAVVLAIAVIPFLLPIGFVGRIGFVQIYMLLAGGAVFAWKEDLITPWLLKIPAVVGILLLIGAMMWLGMAPGLIQMATGVLVPFAILAAMFSIPHTSKLANSFLSSAPMRTIGLYSYSLYLWQQLALSDAALRAGVPAWLGLLAALAFSALSFYWIEGPCRRLARKISPN